MLLLSRCFFDPGRLETLADGEGSSLECTQAFLPGDDDACDNSEPDLGKDEPKPVDALIEHRVDDRQSTVEQSGPEQRSDQSSQEDGVPRNQRQQGAVKDTDQERSAQVNDGSNDESAQ